MKTSTTSSSGCSVKEDLGSPMCQPPTMCHAKMTSTCFPFPHSHGCRPHLLNPTFQIYISGTPVARRALFHFREERRYMCISE